MTSVRPLPVFAILALVAAALGVSLIVYGNVILVQSEAEERGCRAAKDGLAELSCMNFDDIGATILMMWGGVALGVAGLFAIAELWVRSRRRSTV